MLRTPLHTAAARAGKGLHIVATLARAGGLGAVRRLIGGLEGTLLQVENTNYCNFRCGYCVTHSPDSTVSVTRGHMQMSTFAAIVDKHPRAVVCVIQGQGEPFLDPTLFEKIALARRRGLVTQVITNGSMLREETIDRLVHEGPDILLVSLDVVSPAEGERMRAGLNHARASQGVRALVERRRRRRPMVVGLLSILHRPFDQSAEEALRSFDEWGVDIVLYKRLNGAYGERIVGYAPERTTPIPKQVARGVSYILRHQDLKPVAPCSPLAHDTAYYLWDGQRTPCCILNEPRYATPEYSREALLDAFGRGALPSACGDCSFFAGYPGGPR